ncbi:YaeQ family protein [Umboniibacter marinipuniceus]|uniref:Uncharacterized protein YaeQ n=1 Tax=Umboniibacter marinipuniceus TaxID=569599 RepID=A0A3M0A1I4_9GAMM|nr:YaeQ family protein [Umboniibacter marinipuniceus]RMA78823.1 uncharacterized protein YaeQ [Umboniibacter marinipuniceus]
MALKPTIYKFKIALSNLDSNFFDQLELTVAQHPSETPQRMLCRVLCYTLFAHRNISFTKGLSDVDVPDLWSVSNDDHPLLWIEVGEPSLDRLKRACRKAEEAIVVCFKDRSKVWWEGIEAKAAGLNLSVLQFNESALESLTNALARTTELSITITENTFYIAANAEPIEFEINTLK